MIIRNFRARLRARPYLQNWSIGLISLLMLPSCASGVLDHDEADAAIATFLLAKAHKGDIIIWDDATNTSHINWPRAYEIAPDDPGGLVAASYGLSARERLMLTADSNFISGSIGYDLEETMRRLNDDETVYITSPGGRVRAAANAVDVILEKDLNFVVVQTCMSVCAGSILPAAKSVKAFDQPIFAVHGTMHTWLNHLKEGGVEPCESPERRAERIKNLEALVQRTDQQLLRSGHKTDFWKKQKDVLGEQTIVCFDTGEGDIGSFQQFEYDFWLPTSAEFQTYFGLEVEGPLCNDSRRCLENKLVLSIDLDDTIVSMGEVITVAIPVPGVQD